MAPLPHFLRLRKVIICSLFASFFFVLSSSHSLHSLGRRNLLASSSKNVDLDDHDDEFLVQVVPRKNKASFYDDKDEISSKKKKTSPPFDEIMLEKKKKSLPLEDDDEMQFPKKKKSSTTILEDEKMKKSSTTSSKNQTKIIKPKASNLDSSKKDETKVIKPSLSSSSKNKTKLTKPTSKNVDNSSSNSPTINKLKLSKLNSTSKSSSPSKPITKKPLDQPKSNSTAKSKTTATKSTDKVVKSSQSDSADKMTNQKSQNQDQKRKSTSTQILNYQDDEDGDLVAEFRDLPSKFHQSFIPDLHRISTTSKVYLNKYNKEFTKGFKPYVGNKYAPSLATAISCVFIIVPFLLVSLVFNRIKAYFSLQKLIIFIQIYLSIYFTILCFSSLITGLEPLRFFYATSQSTYVWLQVLQTLCYVLYLLLLLMYLILVFSTESDLGQKFLGLGQTFVGFAVGLHYYMTVFHRVVLRQPPKTNWKIHGIYATCFLAICLFASAERRKKAYLVEGNEEGKTS